MPEEMKWFTIYEFACPDCGQRHMDMRFLKKLDQARDVAGIPFVINSGYRCLDHNDMIGGLPDSSHLFGLAADIATEDSPTRYKTLEALLYVGFNRIGVGKNFIHVDLDPRKQKNLIWVY